MIPIAKFVNAPSAQLIIAFSDLAFSFAELSSWCVLTYSIMKTRMLTRKTTSPTINICTLFIASPPPFLSPHYIWIILSYYILTAFLSFVRT